VSVLAHRRDQTASQGQRLLVITEFVAGAQEETIQVAEFGAQGAALATVVGSFNSAAIITAELGPNSRS